MGVDPNANKELTEPKHTEISAKSGSPVSRAERVAETLKALFAPTALEVLDESAAHAGHSGAKPGEQTHLRVRMSTAAFAGLARVARQRAVMAALKSELDSGLHALAMELKADGEV